MNCFSLHSRGGTSVVKDSFTTGAAGNRQAFLDSSTGWKCSEQRRAAEALEADRDDVKELEAAEKKLLKTPEGKGERNC
jgi:hypothetical protein